MNVCYIRHITKQFNSATSLLPMEVKVKNKAGSIPAASNKWRYAMCYVKCRVCGKKIQSYKYNLEDYVYRINNKFFCSWACMLEYEKQTQKPIITQMEWKQEDNNTIKAKGQYGTFRITLIQGKYCARFHGTDNQHFKLNPTQTIEEAKAQCMRNRHWEE